MSKNLLFILMILIAVALSGCTGEGSSKGTPIEVQKFDLANPNLDGQIVDVKFERDDIRAGEIATPELFIANTGSEKIKNETVEITAKVKTLDDSLANLYLKTMSEEKKTRIIEPLNFQTEIKPGTVKSISVKFHTIKEMEGRSLAGTYEITLTLSVNGQKVEARVFPITLLPGEVREITPTPTPLVTSTPSATPTPAPKIKETEISVPTPTPEPDVVATPTGKIIPIKIMNDKFAITHIQIDAGDEIQWVNYNPLDDYDIVEMDEKIPKMVLRNRLSYIFNTTGDYKFGAYYSKMRGDPSIQTISVRVNASK
jgi:plastocyanin